MPQYKCIKKSIVSHHIEIRGCFFHFNQCICYLVKTQSNNFNAKDTYKLRRFLCIIQLYKYLGKTYKVFTITDYITNIFKTLLESEYYLEFFQPIGKIVDYFEDNWLGRPTRQGRISPTFSIPVCGIAMK